MICKPFTDKNNVLSKKDSFLSEKTPVISSVANKISAKDSFVQKIYQMKKILAHNDFELLAHDNIRLIYGKCR